MLSIFILQSMFQNNDFSELTLDDRRVNQVFCGDERNLIDNDAAQNIYELVRDSNGYIVFYEYKGGVCIGVDDHTESLIVNNSQLKYKLAVPSTYIRNNDFLSEREVIVYQTKSKDRVPDSRSIVKKINYIKSVPPGFENIAYAYPVDIVLNERTIEQGNVENDIIEIKSCK